MPIIKSAKKRMKQNAAARKRRRPLVSQLGTVYRKALKLIKDGDKEAVAKFVPHAYSVIDMAAKKNIIHENNAARKKSRIARGLNEMTAGKKAAPATEKKAAPKAKKEEKVDEVAAEAATEKAEA